MLSCSFRKGLMSMQRLVGHSSNHLMKHVFTLVSDGEVKKKSVVL